MKSVWVTKYTDPVTLRPTCSDISSQCSKHGTSCGNYIKETNNYGSPCSIILSGQVLMGMGSTL